MPLFDPGTLSAYVAQAIAQEAQQGHQQATQATNGAHLSNWAYLAPIAAEGADVGTTLYDIQHGAHEGNPIGLPALLPAKVGVTLATLYFMHQLAKDGHPTYAKWLSYLSAIPPAAAAVHNATLFRGKD